MLKRSEGGESAPDLCREIGISTATFHKWRAKFGGMDVSMMSRMKELEGFCQVSCQQVSPVGCGRDDLRLRGLQDAQHRHAPAQEAQAAREGGDVLVAAGARAEEVAQLVVASTEPGR